ncbi:uncharacterized protein GGS22DRAFT_183523 [Annulohypoxylon maeteangense]|uniref:uncharacterized protein n=1 Tax=Annulohypoxylon maeteangense TaxID=1927788 RepID=UPI0020083001|nr:uncharacterized protein GGS22DRAFT_183523 [Annulohypoxylon maeteangense]KAI0890176.1 hypothetical protein GGS22DRAFT_183523 [Annulohypoxylon maeteangense]
MDDRSNFLGRRRDRPGAIRQRQCFGFYFGVEAIRRVKCDETKPACTRCTSTGRKCDGYGGTAPPRPKKSPSAPSSSFSPPLATTSAVTDPFLVPESAAGPSDPYLTKRHELARHSFAAACRGNSALRILRPLAADIEGTEQERQYFHRFRRAAEAGLAMHASSLGAGFWRRLVPLVGQSDPAVRHALIALGAAHESAQLQQEQAQNHNIATATIENPASGVPSRSRSPDVMQHHQHHQQLSYISTPPPEDNSASIDQLELFMIQQYNLSIYHLQQHVQPGSPAESVEITLICCLVFVCIETSRGNEAAALAHVANGLQIIKALPPDSELVHFPPGSSGGKTRAGGSATSAASTSGSSPRISRSDWRQLLDFFLALEPSAATYGFTSSQPPTPPCPTMSAWGTPLECFDEMLPQWDMEGADVEI